MTASIIDGKSIAASIREEVKEKVTQLVQNGKHPPGLAVVLVGEDPASHIYVNNKKKACEHTGIRSIPFHFDDTISEADLLKLIDDLNADDSVHGILVQLPLPSHIDPEKVIEAISPKKDVDGFHPYNIGRLAQRIPLLRPCTPYGVIELLKRTGETFKGRHAVVVGASNIVGRPAVLELMLAGATVSVCHRFSTNTPEMVKMADILVVGVGKAKFVKGEWIKPGATVIDVGMNRLEDGSLSGDVDFESAKDVAAHITPVPGGVGPMTIAMLMKNTYEAACIESE